ncbi:hypothetical protein H2O64_10660 [Kordia sp. YSTF-M3]|uniref:SGNH/GDSL hydrolase family protein n=1 Tax=Kordia aestuariivivens TaxID=2759037 RepID=A0ABR7Q997_9FLAO|nr:hypothetical protein [Kordia aestuariivivens]MBC8755135.1 hypothetical protein [Kordia aestuariivivens]
MKQFLKKITLFGIVFIVVNALIFVSLQRESFGLVTENNRTSFIENQVHTPKIIISGGSNVGYSLDSELLSKNLQQEVYNVSFSISHDYEYVLNYIASSLKKNDTFLYIPEYDQYYINNENTMSDALCVSIYNKPSTFQYLNFQQKINFLTKVPKLNILLLYKNLKHLVSNKTIMLKTDNRGDYVTHLEQSATWKKSAITRYEKYKYDHKLSNQFKNALLKAQKIAESNGAIFYISYPSIAQSQYDERFSKDLKKFYKNSGLKLIGQPETYIFSDDLIFDHPYHLTKEGRKKRTQFLTKDIQKGFTQK